MAVPKRFKALGLMLRISQQEMDRLSAELSNIRQKERDIIEQQEHLQKQCELECYSLSLEAQPFISGFLKAVANQQSILAMQLDGLQRSSETLESRVREKFFERKRWQETLSRSQNSLRDDEQKRDIKQMDEAALAVFTRTRRR